MILRATAFTLIAILASSLAGAQETKADFPKRVLLARHSFFDFGPPFDFYEVISLESEGLSTGVRRILVTPAGNACIQPPAVEAQAATIGKPLAEIMQGKNPCDIPEKALRQERKRCKRCLVFSGVDVTMSISCKVGDRRIRMDILDKDLFDRSANTPPNTSWTMSVLSQIDGSLGPGVMGKAGFSVGTPTSVSPEPISLPMLEDLKNENMTAFSAPIRNSLNSIASRKNPPVCHPSGY